MKNKKYITYVLLIASIAIWGTITYKVYTTLKQESPMVQNASEHPATKKVDSITLLLNYDDPFLGKVTKPSLKKQDNSINEPHSAQPIMASQEPEVISGPAFKFKGVLKAGKTLYGLLDFNGETIMVSKKDKIGDFSVIDISADKLVVRRKGVEMNVFIE